MIPAVLQVFHFHEIVVQFFQTFFVEVSHFSFFFLFATPPISLRLERHQEITVCKLIQLMSIFVFIFVFCRKTSVERKMFSSVVGVIFFVLKLSMKHSLYCRAVSSLINTNVWASLWLGSQNWRVRITLFAIFFLLIFRY